MELQELKKDKKVLIFFIIIVLLGLFVRLDNFDQVALWNDDISTVPSGLLWFYPHSYFPGLSGQAEPPLGNYIIGLGCLSSGEDFSGVSEIQRTFYPGREALLGEPLVNSGTACHTPVYIFGILFFLAVTGFFIILLNKHSALFATSFFAFYPILLRLSRWIHVDVILYFFTTLFLLFLWKFYTTNKNTKKEYIYLFLSALFLGLGSATKFSIGIFLFFTLFIFLNKYKQELYSLIKKLGNLLNLDIANKIQSDKNFKRFLILGIIFLIIFLIAFLIPFQLSISNALDVYTTHKLNNPKLAGIDLNLNIFKPITYSILLEINILDTIILIASIFTLIQLFLKKKSKRELFIFSGVILYIIALIPLHEALEFPRITMPYLILLVALASLAFSSTGNSIFNLLKLHKKKLIFPILLIIYISYSFFLATTSSPEFETTNPINCKLSKNGCQNFLTPYSVKPTAEYLNSKLQDNETFLMFGITDAVIHYYVRPQQSLPSYIFDLRFEQSTGLPNTVQNKILYFRPDNQTVRYILLNPQPLTSRNYKDPLLVDLRDNFNPNDKILLKDTEVVWIYDLANLQEK